MSALLKEEEYDSPLLPQHQRGSLSPSLSISAPTSPSLGSHKPSIFGRARIRAALAAAVALVLVALFGLASRNHFSTQRIPHFGLTKETRPGQRVLIRDGGFGWEGIGSVIQRFKESVILAQALDAQFLITGQESEHGYSTSDLINGPGPILIDSTKTCSLQDNLSGEERAQLVDAWCEGKPEALEILKDLEKRLVGCTAVLDAQRWEVHEEYNGCIHRWTRDTLGAAPEMPWDPAHVTVGIHIRWGDSAGEFRGSMHLDNVNRALGDIYNQFGVDNVDVTIAMEKHEAKILKMVDTRKKYRLVDSGDGINDMRELAGNNIMLIGGSSYAAMAHLIAPRGLSVVDPNVKYMNTTGFGREVIMIQDFDQSSLAGLGALVDGKI
ncbi:hypothetical protein JCM6882_006406 [Rhodosporidiobolus microsporus]